jgi:hypothetical protein
MTTLAVRLQKGVTTYVWRCGHEILTDSSSNSPQGLEHHVLATSGSQSHQGRLVLWIHARSPTLLSRGI